LARNGSQTFAEYPCNGVGGAARRIGHHNAYRFIRICGKRRTRPRYRSCRHDSGNAKGTPLHLVIS
jgi:hypothetical protein